MNKLALCGLLAAAVATAPAQAFQQITHKRIAIDAVDYMKNHRVAPSTTASRPGSTPPVTAWSSSPK